MYNDDDDDCNQNNDDSNIMDGRIIDFMIVFDVLVPFRIRFDCPTNDFWYGIMIDTTTLMSIATDGKVTKMEHKQRTLQFSLQ